jgi:hypothetical protein
MQFKVGNGHIRDSTRTAAWAGMSARRHGARAGMSCERMATVRLVRQLVRPGGDAIAVRRGARWQRRDELGVGLTGTLGRAARRWR